MSDPLVRIEAVSKVFRPGAAPALDQVTATIPEGKIVGLVGPDGAGKTTLLRLLAGLLLPTGGKIQMTGLDTVQCAPQIHELIGYMPQKFGLYEDLTVQQNLHLYANLRSLPRDQWKQQFNRLLTFTGLAPFTKRLARDLSGGMKQKLGLACALISTPTLLLLDEPSVGVDPISRRELWKMVQELLGQGITVIWSTAYLDETERCDLAILLNEGKMVFHGPPSEMTRHAEGRVYRISGIKGSQRALLSRILPQPNIVDGVVQGRDLRVVVKDPQAAVLEASLVEKEALSISPIAPRFEDAFVDLLGGGPKEPSALAERLSPEPSAKETEVVKAVDLTKKFGDFTAVSGVSFTAARGEILGLLGPNGAGKSTTFRMLCGLLKPTEGEAFVEGVDLRTAPAEGRAHIGYMAQKFSLYGGLSVRQNLNFFAGAYDLGIRERRQATREMIEIFNLRDYLNASADTLPLGYKQRLALSCAVMHRPKVLFLDEPTSGVDPITRREFWNHINGFVEKGVAVIVTTHFMDEADYCDRIGLVYRGKLILMDTPDALKARAKSDENPNPTLEDAFIKLIGEYDTQNPIS
jgi:ABC-2 type transport system ATP-binding protein